MKAPRQGTAPDPEPPVDGRHARSQRVRAAITPRRIRSPSAPGWRFVAKAKDKESHCGYQEWHRKVDAEVIEWLKAQEKATPEQFMKMLREIYNRKEMLERFPNGF